MAAKFTKNIITRDEALALVPQYVAFIEKNNSAANWKAGEDAWKAVEAAWQKLRKGQDVITAYNIGDGETPKIIYLRVKVRSVRRNCIQAVDGPVVRVHNDEYAWRVDGCYFCLPVPTGIKECQNVVDEALGFPVPRTPEVAPAPDTSTFIGRVQALVREAKELSDHIGDWKEYQRLSDAFDAKLDALDRENEGLAPGRKLMFGVADGHAVYVVLKVRKNDCIVAHIPVGDAWHFQGVYQDGRGNLVCPRRVAEPQCRGKRLSDMFASRTERPAPAVNV